MKIHSISKIISLPIVMIGATALYVLPKQDLSLPYYLFTSLVLLAILYVSHPYIDYWWHTKFPIPLDRRIVDWLEKYSPFYRSLDEDDKEKYEYRLGLYLEAREFKAIGKEHKELPEDIKAMISSHAVELSFYHKDFLIGDFDRIYLYKHPFPTPKIQVLHTVETELEDGVIILSLEHVAASVLDPANYYNVAMHGYAEAFVKNNQSLKYPDINNDTEAKIAEISQLSYRKILATIGYKEIDILTILITAYFQYPDRFREILPKEHGQLDHIFKTITIPQ